MLSKDTTFPSWGSPAGSARQERCEAVGGQRMRRLPAALTSSLEPSVLLLNLWKTNEDYIPYPVTKCPPKLFAITC